MSATADLASLRAMGAPFVTTGEAAVRLGMTESGASHLLRRLADEGLVLPVRRGLWSLDATPDPLRLAGWVTAPYPSYVSLWSALHAHRMLSQVPRETYLVSLGRAGRIDTRFGTIVVHQIAPEVFGGYTTEHGIALATPAKAIFDIAYLSATHGTRFRRLPELDLRHGYRPREARAWATKIASPRIRTITLERLGRIEREAEAAAFAG